MNYLTNLIVKYKENKNPAILKEIFNILIPAMKKKATHTFFAKWYPLNLYHPCKFCRNCDKLNNIPKSEHSLICENCDICKCVKGFFNLNKNNLCEYNDVYNDLYLTVLEMINKFIPEKEFDNYFYTSLWEWKPSFINQNFVKSLLNKPLSKSNEEGEEYELIEVAEDSEIDKINLKQEAKLKYEEIVKKLLSLCKTEKEKKIINLYINDKQMTQEKVAKILGTYQKDISRILNKLRKRL
jgi:RNA polymerase sigma factor (sigma-70 family)